ncbi:MAG: secondary thiamine-phosphate synthase enzyme YjbQ [Gemmataceae bacterium]
MAVFQQRIDFRSGGHGDMRDVTSEVQTIVDQSRIRIGVVHLFAIGSTAALGVIEFEPGLQRDLPEMLDRLVPPSKAYGHEQTWHDGNGHSHLQATLLGPSLTVPVGEGTLILGTWQQLMHLECDTRPRDRSIAVTVQGE